MTKAARLLLSAAYCLVFSNAAIQSPTAYANSQVTLFELYTPNSQSLCDTDQPWLLGKNPISPFTRLASESCFGIEAAVSDQSHVYLLSQSKESAPLVLLPDNCNALGTQPSDSLFRIPSEQGQLGTLKLDPGVGEEHFYLVLINNDATASKFEKLLTGYPNLCGNQPSLQLKEPFKLFIDQFSNSNEGVSWQVKNFKHD